MISAAKFDPTAYPRAYPASRGWKVFMALLGGIVAFGGLMGVWYFGTGHEVYNIDGQVLLLGMSLAFVLLGFACATMTLRAKLVLAPLAIEEHGLFNVNRVLRQEIAGYRFRIVQGVNLLEVTTNGPKPKVQRISLLFKPDEQFQNWFAGIEDFNESELASSLDEISRDLNAGSSPEARLENLDRARTIAKVLNIAAVMGIVWAIFYPRPYYLMLLTIGLMPWVAIVLCAKYGRLFSIEDAVKVSARADLTRLILGPAIIIGLRALFDTHLLEPIQLIRPTIVGTFALVGCILWVEPGLRTRKGYILVLAVMVASYPAGAIALANEILDRAQPELFRVRVDQMRHTSGKGATAYFNVTPWGPFKEHNEIKVPWLVYRQHSVGDSICISFHSGAFDMSWYRTDEANQC